LAGFDMTSDISLAFAHPEERAIASASADPRDRILLRDYLVDVEIGAFQQERGTRQRVCFNVVVEVSPHAIPLDDDVDRILSYDRITEAISAQLAADRLNLLETLAEGVAERILAEPRAMRVFVRDPDSNQRGQRCTRIGASFGGFFRCRSNCPLKYCGHPR
jgi:7,8-dihydroneopterin aldolase/epimerase/oxygenase